MSIVLRVIGPTNFLDTFVRVAVDVHTETTSGKWFVNVTHGERFSEDARTCSSVSTITCLCLRALDILVYHSHVRVPVGSKLSQWYVASRSRLLHADANPLLQTRSNPQA